jgi:hypothetical protein
VRWSAGDHEPDPVEPARFAGLLGQDEMTQVDRVERAAEKPESHREVDLTSLCRPVRRADNGVDRRAEIG